MKSREDLNNWPHPCCMKSREDLNKSREDLAGNHTLLDLGVPTQEGDSLRTILFPILVFLTQGRGSLTDLVLAV